MVTVFHTEYFPDLFRYSNPAAGYDLGEKGNVLFVHLNWQSDLAEVQQSK